MLIKKYIEKRLNKIQVWITSIKFELKKDSGTLTNSSTSYSFPLFFLKMQTLKSSWRTYSEEGVEVWADEIYDVKEVALGLSFKALIKILWLVSAEVSFILRLVRKSGEQRQSNGFSDQSFYYDIPSFAFTNNVRVGVWLTLWASLVLSTEEWRAGPASRKLAGRSCREVFLVRT